jgi:integrase
MVGVTRRLPADDACRVRVDDPSGVVTWTGSAVFRTFVRSHGLDCTYHSLRHTAASMLLASGVDVHTVSARLGHERPTTTLAMYSHLIGQADLDAAERLEVLLSRSPG